MRSITQRIASNVCGSMNNDNKDYFQGVAYYVLTKDQGFWQILSLSTMGYVAGAVSNK